MYYVLSIFFTVLTTNNHEMIMITMLRSNIISVSVII